jgi:hypothetical protein
VIGSDPYLVSPESSAKIYQEFISQGGEQGPFGYAISDEREGNGPGTRAQLFQNGEIQWDSDLMAGNTNGAILAVYKLNPTTVRFSWNFFDNGPDGYLVRYGLAGNANGETQPPPIDIGGPTGSWDVPNVYPGQTWTFSVEWFTNNTIIPLGEPRYYADRWAQPLIYTMT